MKKKLSSQPIELRSVRVHNLKGVDLTLQPNNLIVFCGVSGSGKSSLAFDTLYVEGQRRYVESLSTFARRYLGDLARPDVEHVSGMSPTISIEQKTVGRSPRSTVGTLTEVYDYLRVLFARVGVPHCPESGEPVRPQSKERIIRQVQCLPVGSKVCLLAPYADMKKGEFKEDFQDLLRKGFMRVRVDGEMRNLNDEIELDRNLSHTIEVVTDRLVVNEESHSRIAEGVQQALELGEGMCRVLDVESGEVQLFSTHAYSEASGKSYPALEPHDFSFNSPSGMCRECQGMGRVQQFDLEKVLDPKKSINKDPCLVAPWYGTVRYRNIFRNLGRLYNFSLTTPWHKLSKEAQRVFLYGNDKKWTRMTFTHPTSKKRWEEYVKWRGVLHEAYQRYQDATSPNYKSGWRMDERAAVSPL